MNADLPAVPPEQPPSLVRAALAVEPRLGELLSADDIETHLRRFARALRISAERDAVANKDTTT